MVFIIVSVNKPHLSEPLDYWYFEYTYGIWTSFLDTQRHPFLKTHIVTNLENRNFFKNDILVSSAGKFHQSAAK